MKKIVIFLITVLSLSAMEPVVNGEWLIKHQNDKNLIIIDVTTEDVYNKGHIPNAVNSGLQKWRKHKGKAAYMARSVEELENEVRRLGINNDSKIVVYSHHINNSDILKAPYIIWALEYLGLENIALLDSGIKSYENANGELSTKQVRYPKSNFKANINQSMITDIDNVKKSINKIAMVDSRPAVYYFGTDKQGVLKRAGHIPGAKSYSWKYSLNKDNSLKSKELLSKVINSGLELNTNEDLIIYCTGGLEAAMNYFVFHNILGFDKAKLYDSSMLEWANRTDTPMTTYRWE